MRVFDHVSGARRPALRGVAHAVGLAAAIPASVVLVWWAHDARVSAAVYGAALIAVLGVSTGYHLLARGQSAQLILSRIDRSVIFLLIAGTYTPIVLVAVPSPGSAWLLAAVWSLAALGILGRATGRLPKTSFSAYLITGWLAVFALPWMFAFSPLLTVGVAVGGLLFTVGAVLFALRRPVAWPKVWGYHEVWHAFTLGGFAAHFACVVLAFRLAGAT